MRYLIIILIAISACDSKQKIPTTVKVEVVFAAAQSIDVEVVGVVEYGHYYDELYPGNEITVYPLSNYDRFKIQPREHLVIDLEKHHDYWITETHID